jgi:hypothetical protein
MKTLWENLARVASYAAAVLLIVGVLAANPQGALADPGDGANASGPPSGGGPSPDPCNVNNGNKNGCLNTTCNSGKTDCRWSDSTTLCTCP